MRFGRTSRVLLAFIAVGTVACGRPDITSDVTSAVKQIVTAPSPHHADRTVHDGLRRFYAGRHHAPRWVGGDQPDAAAAEALRIVRSAPNHGLSAADYDEAALSRIIETAEQKPVEETLQRDAHAIARFDVRVTTALLSLGRDVALGRSRPERIDGRWKLRRTPPDLVAALSQTAGAPLDSWLDSIRPGHPEYAALQHTLTDLHRQLGTAAAQDPRVGQIALNMERWRWMPDDLGARHILVNIPAFYMAVRESGHPVLEMKVVVGKADLATPVFSGEMSTVVFSPYWNVPESIAEGETAPAAARDPDFLRRNQIEILRVSRQGTDVVDPATVTWDDAEAIKELAFRQKPGPGNALGHVKFLFPNKYDVYLHDTPADALFAREGRALSHGCVRLERPEELARYMLRDRSEWDEVRIQEAMHAGVEQHVALDEKIPVHIVYFTAWPDGKGGIRTWPDVYGYDAKRARHRSTAEVQLSKLD